MQVWPFATLLITLACVGAAMYALMVFLMARILTRPRRLTDARALARLGRMSPTDIGLEFSPCEFSVTDQRDGQPLRLAGWWIPGQQSDRCILLIHGYADAKVGAIAWAPMLLELGWNVLAIDLRAHGESGGRDTTAGYFERHDIDQVIEQLMGRYPDQTRQMAILGCSMGAAVAAATAEIRGGLRGIILDSPYARFRDAAKTHGALTGLPGESFVIVAWKLSQWLTGAHFDEVDPVRTIPRAKCPVLVISASQDLLVDSQAQADLRSAVLGRNSVDSSGIRPSGFYWQVDAGHVLNLPARPEEYRQHIAEFLSGEAVGSERSQSISGRT